MATTSDLAAPPRIVLTARDRRLLGFAFEHQIVLAAQIAVVLECSEGAARRRLSRLRQAGWMQSRRQLYRRPATWSITADGCAAIGAPAAQQRKLSLSGHDHAVGLGWLTAAAQSGRFGPLAEIETERRLYAQRAGAGGIWHPAPVPPATHRPDLVVRTAAGHRIAFELELSNKGVRRLRRILADHARDPSLDAVVYLVDRPDIARTLARAAADLGADARVRIQHITWADGGRPSDAPARTAARAAPVTERAGAGAAPGPAVALTHAGDREPAGVDR